MFPPSDFHRIAVIVTNLGTWPSLLHQRQILRLEDGHTTIRDRAVGVYYEIRRVGHPSVSRHDLGPRGGIPGHCRRSIVRTSLRIDLLVACYGSSVEISDCSSRDLVYLRGRS